MSDPHAVPYGDPEAARRLTEDIGRELYALLPVEAQDIKYTVCAVAPTTLEFAEWRTADGSKHPVRVSDHLTALAAQLRSAMYRPGAGTWFTAELTVTSAASMDAHFDYDNEPEWDAPVPPPYTGKTSPNSRETEERFLPGSRNAWPEPGSDKTSPDRVRVPACRLTTHGAVATAVRKEPACGGFSAALPAEPGRDGRCRRHADLPHLR